MKSETFALCLRERCSIGRNAHVLAAVSGGADSMALLCLLDEMRGQLALRVSCVHVEHGIRGEASLADMAFVERACVQRGIPFYAERVDAPAYAKEHGCGMENAARTLRYEVFVQIARKIGADAVALAHHMQDQAETVLQHAARGSDVRGLCGMRWRRGFFIRPLLGETPQSLRAYLTKIGQPWREDETNADPAYVRNRIRHETLPGLEAMYPGATAALARLAEAAQRDEAYFEREIEHRGLGKTIRLVDGLAVAIADCRELDEAMTSRLVRKRIEQAQIDVPDAETIRRLARGVSDAEEGTINLPGGAHAYLEGEWLYLIRREGVAGETALSSLGETQTPFGAFRVREAQAGEVGDGVTSQAFDEHLLRGAWVTQRREGDAMVPFGRHTPVKLKKLAIDAGIPRPMRNSLPVLRGEEGVLWAAGLRPSALCGQDGGGRKLMVEWIGAFPYLK